MLLLYMANYIKNKKVKQKKINNMPKLKEFGKAVQSFISFIYKSGWNSLYTDKENRMFRQKVASKFTLKISNSNFYSNSSKFKDKFAEIAKLSSLIPARLPKEVLKKSKFFKKEKNQLQQSNQTINNHIFKQ